MAKRTPSAKNNDRLWHCTNDEARGTVFVKGAARRSASTWPVPTRIADGATIKVFGCHPPRLCDDHELGAAPQIEGALAYRGRVAFDVADVPCFYLTFDRSTGKLRAMCFSFELEVHNILADDDEPDALIEGRPMSNSTFCALLHAGLDESVRRAARGASQQSRP